MNGYRINLDYSKNINEQELLQDTKVIMSLIYRDYLCSEEERNKLIAQDEKALSEYEEKIREKYNLDNLFKDNTLKNTKLIQSDETTAETAVTKYKETLFTRIKKVIRKLVH